MEETHVTCTGQRQKSIWKRPFLQVQATKDEVEDVATSESEQTEGTPPSFVADEGSQQSSSTERPGQETEGHEGIIPGQSNDAGLPTQNHGPSGIPLSARSQHATSYRSILSP